MTTSNTRSLVNLGMDVPASHITTLHFAAGLPVANYEELHSNLSHCTALELLVLEVKFQHVPASPFDDLYQGIIMLPSLHTLHLRGAPCLHLFNAPQLHTLHLSYDPPFPAAHIETSSHGLNTTNDQGSQLARTLENLGAYRFGGIRHLSVLGPHIDVILASLAQTEEKAVAPSANIKPYWPKLESISLPAYRPGIAGLIYRFMWFRFAAEGIRLPKIRLPTTFAADPFAEWLEDNDCLELYDNDIDSLPGRL